MGDDIQALVMSCRTCLSWFVFSALYLNTSLYVCVCVCIHTHTSVDKLKVNHNILVPV